jgi:hypothetical protein
MSSLLFYNVKTNVKIKKNPGMSRCVQTFGTICDITNIVSSAGELKIYYDVTYIHNTFPVHILWTIIPGAFGSPTLPITVGLRDDCLFHKHAFDFPSMCL